MSTILEFYSVSWTELRQTIGSRDRKLYRTVLKQAEPEFEGIYGPASFGTGPDFAEGLERWIEGELGTAETEVREASLGEALGLIALVKYHGQFVGSLQHAVRSGAAFEERFLEGVATSSLQPSFPLTQLTSRSLFGLEQEDPPFWGGLSASELASLAPRLAQDAPTDADPNLDQWLMGLWNALGSALDLGKDLVTIYG